MKKIVIFLLGIMVLLTGCSNKQDSLSDKKNIKLALKDSSWTLYKINDNLFKPFVINGEALGFSTLDFGEKELFGNTGTNQFRSNFTIDEDNLTTTPILMTRMAAPNIILANNEQEILGILDSNEKKLEQNEENLTITTPKGTLFYQKNNPLKNSSWKLKTMPNIDLLTLNDKNIKLPTLEFSQKRLYGFSGVNNYNADYVLNNDKVNIGIMRATLMAGISEDANKIESEFLNSLNNAKTFSIDKNSNELSFGDLQFENIGFQNGTLNNNIWNLVAINNEDITQLLKQHKVQDLSIQFKDNGIAGFSGVNRFTGQYAIKNRNIYISAIASTLMFGLNEEINKLEQKYINILYNAEYFELINHETMIFHSQNSTLTFKRVYM